MVNVPISCDGVVVNPGDLIVADGDGVICVPREEAEEALAGARAGLDREDSIAEAIRNGSSPWELAKIGANYEALGVHEIDAAYGAK